MVYFYSKMATNSRCGKPIIKLFPSNTNHMFLYLQFFFFYLFLPFQTSYDPTAYVQRARVTRAAPPKPAANPLQFVQIKPCNLYQSAQEQLKRAEEVKKVKEIKKEEPEDWQSVSRRMKKKTNTIQFFFASASYLCEKSKFYEPANAIRCAHT